MNLGAAIVPRLLPLHASERAELSRFVHPVVRNWDGIEVGAVRVTDVLSSP